MCGPKILVRSHKVGNELIESLQPPELLGPTEKRRGTVKVHLKFQRKEKKKKRK